MSLDMTLTTTKRNLLKRKSKRLGSTGLDDEKNVLLEDNTLPYLFSDGKVREDRNGSDSSSIISNASLLFENGHTRWYHRCFKCNIALTHGQISLPPFKNNMRAVLEKAQLSMFLSNFSKL